MPYLLSVSAYENYIYFSILTRDLIRNILMLYFEVTENKALLHKQPVESIYRNSSLLLFCNIAIINSKKIP